MSKLCSICTQTVNLKSPGIQCSFCLNFYHARCGDLTKDQLALFTNIPGAMYKCTGCRKNKSDDHAAKCSNCENMGKALENLKLMIQNLQDEVKNLKQSGNMETCNSQEIINEISERHKKEKNIIIYNLPEQANGSSAQKHTADLQKTKEVLQSLTPEVETDHIKISRLGKPAQNKVLPLKVQLSSREDVFLILKNKKKLRELNINIQISTDKTPFQRQQLKSTIDQLNERKTKGEENLYIKYINGNPTIAQSKKLE